MEGAEHPFLVWTDHKNLEYLHTAKHLNSRQAHWALLFNHFNFTLSYRPGSNNVKLDALSQLYCPAATLSDPRPSTLLRHSIPSRNPRGVRLTGCFSRTLPVPRSWNGHIPQEGSAFVAACTVCAQNKTQRKALAGRLQPLPVPHRPRSHISLNFATGFPRQKATLLP